MSALRFRFDEFEVDPANFQLRRSGSPVPIERIPMELLLILVEKSGQLVNRGEILERIWGKEVFLDTDSAVSTAVRKLRRALSDDASHPRYIETVMAKGYRFIAPVQQDLPSASGEGHPEESVSLPATTPLRVRSHKSIAIASAAAVVILLAVLGWLFFSPKTHALSNKDTIVLVDFANSTGDPVFDETLKQGLAVQLGQSPLLNILPEQKVRSALAQMTHSPNEALTLSAAKEVCERTGSKAYIAGSIANLGGRYVIGLNAIHCTTGDVLAREQTEAADKRQVLTALGRVTENLRNKLGESLSSIHKFDVPLAEATTSSLEALRAYSFGLAKFANGDQVGSIPFFQQAIELDPAFAIAYANLGRAHQILRQHQRMEDALRRAFELRDRTSAREKFDISAVYYQFVTKQTDQTIRTCELWAETYPSDFTPHRILGFEYGGLGRPEPAAREFRRAVELDPGQSISYAGLMLNYMALNRAAEAHAAYDEGRKLGLVALGMTRYLLAFLEGDSEMLAKVAASSAERPSHENKLLLAISLSEAYVGHLARARELSRQAEDAASASGDKATAADIEATAALVEELFGNSAAARRHVAGALSLSAPATVGLAPAGDWVQPTVALALAGDRVLAASVADRLASDLPPDGFANRVSLPEIRAAIELKRGNPARAVELLAPTASYEAGIFDRFLAAYLRGEAYRADHRGREAAAEFQKIIDHRGVVLNSPIGALAHLGAARSYMVAGDNARARLAYEDFLALWKDADPSIPVLSAAKSEYAHLN
jgi:DNA-binding winged helix-turn-helix (wHTH) protein/tetratricopeptide (TPR) repeat protein